MARIKSLNAYTILNSRGVTTIEVELELTSGARVSASVPEGASKGQEEAETSVPQVAIESIKGPIAHALKGREVGKQDEIDQVLLELEGANAKHVFGANALLGVSIAYAKASAKALNLPLWQFLKNSCGLEAEKDNKSLPRLFVNVINGGQHANNNIDYQEYIFIVKGETLADSINISVLLYSKLREEMIKKLGNISLGVGDEGGFAPNFNDNLEPFILMKHVIDELKLSNKVTLGLDAAANSIQKNTDVLFGEYRKMSEKFNLSYLEDPFQENDIEFFKTIYETLSENMLISGDDITVTNEKRIGDAIEKKLINAVIIKPNQIGTLTETYKAVQTAKKLNCEYIVSHRSGETNDDFIADLAYGLNAYGFKLGAPARGERIAKYNRLLAIERELGLN